MSADLIQQLVPSCGTSALAPRQMSMKERLFQESTTLEARLSQLNEAIKALEAAREVERVLEILSKTIY